MLEKITLFLIAFAFSTASLAQQATPLLLKNGTIPLASNAQDFAQGFQPSATDLHQGHYYLIVQFASTPTQVEREGIEALGIQLLSYLPNRAYVASIPQGFDLEQLNSRGAVAYMQPDHRVKLSKAIYSGTLPAHSIVGDQIDVLVTLYDDVSKTDVITQFVKYFEVVDEYSHPRNTTVRLNPSQMQDLVSLPFVQFIQPSLPAPTPDDREGRSLHRSNVLNSDYGAGRHYDGTGVTIGLADDGLIGPHIDYQGRFSQFPTTDGGSHGDMTAGILFGAGNRDPLIRGHATGAYLYYWSIGGYPQVVDAVSNYSQYGVILTSTSYSQGTGGVYDGTTSFIDEQIYDNPQLLHMFSAGNAGNSDHGYGAGAGWGNITGGRKAGKSVITCGNLSYLDILENSSSRGPADDGRIKPDISANGFQQLSTAAGNTNQVGGGTSAAAPSVAGTVTQLYHAYKELNNGQEPESPLIKAAVLNTAEDLGNPGPDFQHGWGRINALGAVRVLENNTYLKESISQGQTKTHQITVPANTAELRAMVYWLDPEGNTSAARALVNNINMTVTDPGNTSWNPWILDHTPTVAALNSNAVRGVDSINNMEQVTLTSPAAGIYTVTVTGTDIPMGPQEYYVVWEAREQGIDITYPIGGEGFVPGDNQAIRWDAHGVTGTFSVEYSTNGGTTWNMISNSVPNSRRYFEWNVPTVVTGDARIRISSGAASDMSDEDFTIVGLPTNIQVDFVCPDSIGISWNPVGGATGYEVSALGAQYMDSMATSTGTSAVVTGLNPTSEHWFSVKALTPNGGEGRRQTAIFYGGGTFNCLLPVDIALENLNSPPQGLLPDCQASASAPVIIEVTNYGTSPVSNIAVGYQVNGGAVVNETVSGPIAPGATTTYTFTQTANLGSAGSYNVSSWINFPGDMNSYNDSTLNTLTVSPSLVVNLPVTENFESFNSCATTSNCEATTCNLSSGWVNAINLSEDDIDWRIDAGGTPSNQTGPSTDHNPGTSNGNYAYLEASGGCEDKAAWLISPCLDLTNSVNPQMTFWYHMDGIEMGELHVDVLSGGAWTLDVISPVVGNQQDVWRQATLNLTPFTGGIANIRIRGVTGNGYRSDIAIDDITILESNAAPAALFNASSTNTCPNQTITFTDQSLNGPTSWNWTITPTTFNYVGGTSASSQNPQVQFTAPGVYTVALQATNAFGSNTLTETNYINISNGAVLPMVEDFENAFLPAGWDIFNNDGDITWDEATSITGANGNNTDAAFVNNFDYNSAGEEDDLISVALDLTLASGATMTFDVAYAPFSATLFDGLRVEVSTDCGNTFTPSGYDKSGTTLATAGVSQSRWAPSGAGDWRNESIDLTPYVGNQVVVKFVNVNGYGNNLFVDNVNVTSFVGVEDGLDASSILVYPNPNDGRFKVVVDKLPLGAANLSVIDLTGRSIFSQNVNGDGGYFTTELDLNKISSGIYYLQVQSSNGKQVKKLVIE